MFGWILEFFEDPFFCMVITLTSAFRSFNIKHCKRRLTYCMDSVKEPWFSWSILVCPKVNLRNDNAQKIVETQCTYNAYDHIKKQHAQCFHFNHFHQIEKQHVQCLNFNLILKRIEVERD